MINSSEFFGLLRSVCQAVRLDYNIFISGKFLNCCSIKSGVRAGKVKADFSCDSGGVNEAVAGESQVLTIGCNVIVEYIHYPYTWDLQLFDHHQGHL